MQQSQYLTVLDVWHTIVTILPRLNVGNLFCISTNKFAKNANVCKNGMLGLIHQDPYKLRYMVGQYLGPSIDVGSAMTTKILMVNLRTVDMI